MANSIARPAVNSRSFWLRMRALNQFVVTRLRQGRGPQSTVLLLTTKGRRTGLPRVTPLQFEEQDGVYYVAAGRGVHADWFQNVAAEPEVQVAVRGRTFAAVGEPVTDAQRMTDFLTLRLRRHPLLVRAIMCAEGLPLRYSQADLEAFAREKAMVVLRPVNPAALPRPPAPRRGNPIAAIVIAATATVTVSLAVYHLLVRGRQVRWGAAGAEVKAALPGAVIALEPGGIRARAERSAPGGINVMVRKRGEAVTGVCREIAPDLYRLEVGGGFDRSNVYFVRSPSGWVLIDTASKNCGRFIRMAAESLFGANTRPEVILLTHDHPDHAGSVLELVRMWGAPVYVHPDEWPLVALSDIATIEQYANPLDRWLILPILRTMPRRRVESMLARECLESVVRVFDPRAAVPGLPDWQCIPTPGHTPGHAAFFRSSDRVLIAGDALVTVDLNSWRSVLMWLLRRPTMCVSGPPWYSTWNRRVATESVIALAGLEPRVLASGHGMPMSGDEIPAAVRAFADSLARLARVQRARA